MGIHDQVENGNGVHDAEDSAERAVLSVMLRDNATIGPVLQILRVEDFRLDAHQKVFRAIVDLSAKGSPADAVSVADCLHFRNQIDHVRYTYLAELKTTFASAANAKCYAGIVRENSQKRSLVDVARKLLDDAQRNGAPASRLVECALDDLSSIDRDPAARSSGGTPSPPLSFERLTGRQFFDAEYRQDFLIEGVIADGQPGIIGALKKSLKTTLAIEQSISLARGLPFLGHFRVPHPVCVGIMSGESGAYTIQETFKRIAKEKQWEPGENDNLRICFRIPHLGDPLHLDALRRFICEDELRVLYIDPTYLALPVAENAGNIFAVGNLLLGLTELGQETGCTIQLVHHLRKNLNHPFDVPELEDLAWSAFAEWARQWLLIGRRERYDPESDGEHKLWLNIGGSAGHSSLWGLDVWEGRLTDPGGRRWCAVLKTATMVREQAAEGDQKERDGRKELRQQATRKANREKVVRALRQYPKGGTKTELRDAAGLSGQMFGPILTAMLEDGSAVPCTIKKGGKRGYDGFRLKADSLFPEHQPDNPDNGTKSPGQVVRPGESQRDGQPPI